MGSRAYGVANKDSDWDLYGVCVPPFANVIGFGGTFEQYQPQNHIVLDGKEYDITIYSIVKFFTLAAQNNPNIIDFLFVPRNCVLHSTNAWDEIRDNRRMFLHKGCWHRFKNYASSQLSKINSKQYVHSKRIELVKKYGYDVKFAYHLVRLLLEVEQILQEQDLDLQRNSDVLKAIRRGEWTLEKVNEWFQEKEKYLEKVYETSLLPVKPDMKALERLLMSVLRNHYDQIPIVSNDNLLDELKMLVNKYGE